MKSDYDRFWQKKEAKWGRRRERLEMCLPFLKERARWKNVLEVGCGTGEGLAWLQEYGIEAVGLDISEWAVQQARRRGWNAHVADVCTFSWPQTFSLILCLEVLEHLPEPERGLANLLRHLAGDGLLLLSLPNDGHLFLNSGIFPPNPWHISPFWRRRYGRLFSPFPVTVELVDLQPLLPQGVPWRHYLARRFPHHLALSLLFALRLRSRREGR